MRIAVVALIAIGCGGRTGLLAPDEQLGPGPSPTDSAVTDSSTEDTAVVDSGVDAPLTEVGCTNNRECDDGIACTSDVCDLTAGRCRNIPSDSACDDGLWCNGEEKCDALEGCFNVPRTCADALDCSDDRCDEAGKRCVHTPNDARCPISHTCDLSLGCQARAIAHTQTELYDIRLPSGVVTKIGPTSGSLTDVALHPSGTLYGVKFEGLCVVDLKTGSCGMVTPLSGSPVALDAAPDGTLYGAAGSIVYSINRTTGMTTTVARFPMGLQASGDLAFLSTGRLLGTARGTGASALDLLVEFDLKAGTSKTLGSTGFRCVWGLAAYGPTLYGLTCEGRVIRIDPNSGASVELSKVAAEFWGATAR